MRTLNLVMITCMVGCAPASIVQANGVATSPRVLEMGSLSVRAIARTENWAYGDSPDAKVRVHPSFAFVTADDDRFRMVVTSTQIMDKIARVIEFGASGVVDLTNELVTPRDPAGGTATPIAIVNASSVRPIVMLLRPYSRTGIPDAYVRVKGEWEGWSLPVDEEYARPVDAFSFVDPASKGMPRVWVSMQVGCADDREQDDPRDGGRPKPRSLGNCERRVNTFRALGDDGKDIVKLPDGVVSLAVLRTGPELTIAAHVVDPPRSAEPNGTESIAFISKGANKRLRLEHPVGGESQVLQAGTAIYLVAVHVSNPSLAYVENMQVKNIAPHVDWPSRDRQVMAATTLPDGRLVVSVASMGWPVATNGSVWSWSPRSGWERVVTPSPAPDMSCTVGQLKWTQGALWAIEACARTRDNDAPDGERILESRLLTSQPVSGPATVLHPSWYRPE